MVPLWWEHYYGPDNLFITCISLQPIYYKLEGKKKVSVPAEQEGQ